MFLSDQERSREKLLRMDGLNIFYASSSARGKKEVNTR